ncbi:MAG: hypothetical protein FWC38_03165 [Proteobacteria bacterium]|nr:hypothetical protein [Pseudomonadota bacterium]MCL2307230.1 hypothetical protein [Pseudomonadota bacterium]
MALVLWIVALVVGIYFFVDSEYQEVAMIFGGTVTVTTLLVGGAASSLFGDDDSV